MKTVAFLLTFLLAADAFSQSKCREDAPILRLTCPCMCRVGLLLTSSSSSTATITTEPKSSVKPLVDLQKAATGAIAAATIASSVLSWAPPPADASFAFSSSQVVAEKVIREGIYGEYEVDLPEQVYDDARSTFKSAKETKTKKGKFRNWTYSIHAYSRIGMLDQELTFLKHFLCRKIHGVVGDLDCWKLCHSHGVSSTLSSWLLDTHRSTTSMRLLTQSQFWFLCS